MKIMCLFLVTKCRISKMKVKGYKHIRVQITLQVLREYFQFPGIYSTIFNYIKPKESKNLNTRYYLISELSEINKDYYLDYLK